MRRSVVLVGSSLLASSLGLFVACVGDTPANTPVIDGGNPDNKDSSPAADTSPVPDSAPSNAFLDPTAAANWEEAPLQGNGYFGGAALNGYVYFAPAATTVLRYDTKKPFTAVGAWDTVDIAKFSVNSPAIGSGYRGAVADSNGRVWFINNGLPGGKSTYVNVIDGKDFSTAAAWTIVDFQGDSRMYGYFGGAVEGTSMFWFPYIKNNCGGCSADALFLLRHTIGTMQYDNKNLLNDAPNVTASYGGNVVSGFVYTSVHDGVAMRHASSNFMGAFDVFDTTTLSPALTNAKGAVFDGKYLYFPGTNVVARYDTTKDFTSSGSWSSASVNGQLGGGQFDGQRVIFAPDGMGSAVVYDTTFPFAQSSSWHSHPLKGQIAGTAYDGQYVYFAPNDSSTPAQRFKAHTMATSPQGGSTF